MAVTLTATVLVHFYYQATIVFLRMFASFLWVQAILIWNVAKCMPIVLNTLWVVTIRMGEGFFLPVACRLGSYLWTCLSDTYSALYNASGITEAVSYASTKRELWVLSLCHWQAYIIVGIVGSAIIFMYDHFDAFDKRTARAMVPTPGAYNYGKAYKLNRVDETTNSEE
jgi:hypothetical protein